MPKNPASAKIATDRDLEIMRLLGTDGVAGLTTIHNRFWPDAQPQTARDRLLQLEKAGWLEQHYIDPPSTGRGKLKSNVRDCLVYNLTDRGAKAHFGPVERKSMITKLPAPNEIYQQLMAQQARFRLENRLKEDGLALTGWHNERQLRSQTRLQQRPGVRAWKNRAGVADAQASIFNPATGETVGQLVEVDGQYYGQMLKQKIAAIARAGKSTLWITTPDRANRIMSEVKAAGAGTVIQIMVISDRN